MAIEQRELPISPEAELERLAQQLRIDRQFAEIHDKLGLLYQVQREEARQSASLQALADFRRRFPQVSTQAALVYDEQGTPRMQVSVPVSPTDSDPTFSAKLLNYMVGLDPDGGLDISVLESAPIVEEPRPLSAAMGFKRFSSGIRDRLFRRDRERLGSGGEPVTDRTQSKRKQILMAVGSVAALVGIAAFVVLGRHAGVAPAAEVNHGSDRVAVNSDSIHMRSENGTLVAGATPPIDDGDESQPAQLVLPPKLLAPAPAPATPIPEPTRPIEQPTAVPTPQLQPSPSAPLEQAPAAPTAQVEQPVPIKPTVAPVQPPVAVHDQAPKLSPQEQAFEQFVDRKIEFTRDGQTLWSSLVIPDGEQRWLKSETPKGWQMGALTEEDFDRDVIVKLARQRFQEGKSSINPDIVHVGDQLTVRELLGNKVDIAKKTILAADLDQSLQIWAQR